MLTKAQKEGQMLEVISMDTRGMIAADSSGQRKFIPYHEVQNKFLAFVHNSPKGVEGDRTILIPA